MSGESGFTLKKWGENEKYSFVLQILKQHVDGESKVPNFQKINLPGRTPKAMSHQWTALRKDMNSIGADGAVAGNQAAGGGSSRKRGGGKTAGSPAKKAKASEEVESEEASDEAENGDQE